MIEQDTVKLLRECDAGIQMGIAAIDDVLDYVDDEAFLKCLLDCKSKHVKMQEEIQALLAAQDEKGKEPNPAAKSMS